ncbi:MAG: DUF1905 domain-containing protein [Candidatus Liptonbacteria bacterium]
MAKYKVIGKLSVFPGPAPWTYVPIPNEKVPVGKPGVWGSFPVMATVGKTTWRTSLFPAKGKKYFIPIKQSVCKKESLKPGDRVKVEYEIYTGFGQGLNLRT